MKPLCCPFCKGKAHTYEDDLSEPHDKHYSVKCDKCGFDVCLCSDPCPTKLKAIIAWNEVAELAKKIKCPGCGRTASPIYISGVLKCPVCQYKVTCEEENWDETFNKFSRISTFD